MSKVKPAADTGPLVLMSVLLHWPANAPVGAGDWPPHFNPASGGGALVAAVKSSPTRVLQREERAASLQVL